MTSTDSRDLGRPSSWSAKLEELTSGPEDGSKRLLIVSAGNDGRGAVQQAQRILSGFPLPAAAEPLILRGEPGEAQLQASRELGQGFAAGLAMGIF